MDDDVKALKEKQLDKINGVTGEIRKCKICNNLMSNGYFTRSPIICDDCVAKSLMEVVPKTVSDRLDQIIELARENNTPDRTCTRCGSTGPEKGFHKAGASGYINVCRKCIRKRQEDNRKSRGLLATDIVIKFADYPQALEQIKREADRNFRTVEHEILFRLVRMGAIND